jgi:hypothetical protein
MSENKFSVIASGGIARPGGEIVKNSLLCHECPVLTLCTMGAVFFSVIASFIAILKDRM